MKNEEEKKSIMRECKCCGMMSDEELLAAKTKLDIAIERNAKDIEEAEENLAMAIENGGRKIYYYKGIENDIGLGEEIKLFNRYGEEISLVERYIEELEWLEEERQELYDRWVVLREETICQYLESERIEQAWNEVLGIY